MTPKCKKGNTKSSKRTHSVVREHIILLQPLWRGDDIVVACCRC